MYMIHIYIYICLCLFALLSICLCIFVCLFDLCMFMCIYIYVHIIYIYIIYIHTYIQKLDSRAWTCAGLWLWQRLNAKAAPSLRAGCSRVVRAMPALLPEISGLGWLVEGLGFRVSGFLGFGLKGCRLTLRQVTCRRHLQALIAIFVERPTPVRKHLGSRMQRIQGLTRRKATQD